MPKKGRDWSGKVGNDPTKTIIVKQDSKAEVATEVLAAAIVAMAEGVKKLRAGPIKDRTLCLLIADASPSYGKGSVNMREVKAVLDGIEALERTHLKSKKRDG